MVTSIRSTSVAARAQQDPQFVDLAPRQFLMIDGSGNPNTSPEYRDAVSALYSLAYSLKFALKKRGVEFSVGPLEGLWWTDDMATFDAQRKDEWRWTMMIGQPDEVTPELFEQVVKEVARKKALPALGKVRLAIFSEGHAAQILHIGSYATEGPTVARLHRFIHDHGGSFDGREQKHHEIYISDPSRTAPERLRTIVRQPIAPA